jgi:hypothetical protein
MEDSLGACNGQRGHLPRDPCANVYISLFSNHDPQQLAACVVVLNYPGTYVLNFKKIFLYEIPRLEVGFISRL